MGKDVVSFKIFLYSKVKMVREVNGFVTCEHLSFTEGFKWYGLLLCFFSFQSVVLIGS